MRRKIGVGTPGLRTLCMPLPSHTVKRLSSMQTGNYHFQTQILGQAPLTPMTEKEASKLPNLSEMLRQLRSKAPAPMVDQLEGFKANSVPALNSFVHAGIHTISRHGAGYPEHLVDRVVRQSNALMTMAGMLLAVVGSDEDSTVEMRRIQRPFEDCLPELLSG